MAKLLTIKNLTKIYKSTFGIENICVSIDNGEFVILSGASGAGKTTLLRMLYLDEKPDAGGIVFDGISSENISKKELICLRRKYGIIFQDFKLFYDRTVYQNLEFVLQVTSCPKKDIKKRIIKTLLYVDLHDRVNDNPKILSGGEQQRLAIARAIINNPKMILADEPFRNLDNDTAFDIYKLLLKINSLGTAIILSTHDKYIIENSPFRKVIISHGKIISDSRKNIKKQV